MRVPYLPVKASQIPPLELSKVASIARIEIPSRPSRPTVKPRPTTSRPGTRVLPSRIAPVVPATGPIERGVICMPVAKMTSAISGIGVAKRAVVKLPSSRTPGAVVPTIAPSTSGITMVPPGMRSIVPYRGERSVEVSGERSVTGTPSCLITRRSARWVLLARSGPESPRQQGYRIYGARRGVNHQPRAGCPGAARRGSAPPCVDQRHPAWISAARDGPRPAGRPRGSRGRRRRRSARAPSVDPGSPPPDAPRPGSRRERRPSRSCR